MCGEFKCIHQQYGICNYDDTKCEGKVCMNFNDCSQCEYGGAGCLDEYGEDE